MTPRGAPVAAPEVALCFASFGGGGLERVMLALAEGLLARGVTVDLVVVNARGPLQALVPAGATVVDLGARRAAGAVRPLAAYLRRRRPRAMLAAHTHVNVAAIAARAFARVPTRLVVSEHVAIDVAARHTGLWQERWLPLAARLTYRRADGVVAVSRATADRLACTLGMPREAIVVIYNPIVTPQLLAEAARPAGHPWLVPGHGPVIITAGRLVPQKDHRTLIDAFARLRAGHPAKLIILGEGPERPSLEALVRSRGLEQDVALPGFVLHPAAYIASASLFVLSSRWEGFGNVLVEAMACGVPVVSTDCPSGPAEALDGGRCGRLVPVGDAAALADAMARALAAPVAAEVLRARAGVFTPPHAVDAYLEVLRP